ncbi:Putative teichuronic acid biosynthesis glycosyltransferase TuaC [Stieleria maiorica]|uniref:Teichuronic acid biosynthesis glycosyltransferase TuaC n=1 Tax=Stieleria maiorica TaxID=2795974 RepID=A0A5B9MFJ5_9BACT|nr:glycosyltransferase [Stieleria maiorica]QEF99613.1 Putative teichuronic acid biosynthesis glycosyltransferase TuaC [Stieleria maiorica]
MIRIALVVHGFQNGGIERSITRIVNGLDAQRFEPVIICLDTTGPAADWLERDVPVIEIGKRSGNDVLAVKRLADCLRQHQIDLVQSHNWGTLVESVIARKLARTPVHIHAERGTVAGMVEASGLRYWCRAKVMSMALGSVDQVISNAHAVAERIESRCGFKAENIQIIPNGVPNPVNTDHAQNRQQIRSELGLPTDAIVVGSAGRLVDVKGFDLAITAIQQVLQSEPNVHLVILGDGPEEQRLNSIAGRCGISDHIHFVGRREDVPAWLDSFDIYLNSSRSEGMSQSVIEAMSVGLPIIATDVGDNALLVQGSQFQCGLVCEPGSVESIAGQIVKLASDSGLRARCANSARSCHRQFYSDETFNRRISDLYIRLMGHHKGTTAPCDAQRLADLSMQKRPQQSEV